MTINTMHAQGVAAPAAGARSCAAAHGDHWYAQMWSGMGFELVNATTIKRTTARRLGKPAT